MRLPWPLCYLDPRWWRRHVRLRKGWTQADEDRYHAVWRTFALPRSPMIVEAPPATGKSLEAIRGWTPPALGGYQAAPAAVDPIDVYHAEKAQRLEAEVLELRRQLAAARDAVGTLVVAADREREFVLELLVAARSDLAGERWESLSLDVRTCWDSRVAALQFVAKPRSCAHQPFPGG